MNEERYHEDIRDHFWAVLEEDRNEFIEEWMISWAYVDKKRKRGVSYSNGLPQDFYEYRGASDLLEWFNYAAEMSAPCYFSDEAIVGSVRRSQRLDEQILSNLSLSFDMARYASTIGRFNAQDFLFQNLYPSPERYEVRRVLDFGAGCGRQANLWTQERPNLVYVGMDGIPLPYCLQHLYYSQLSPAISDYAVDPSSFGICDQPGIYHLPTWRADLLPDSFFDMVICAQVLQELHPKLLRFAIEMFRRVLKPGGALYIRDHDQAFQPVHKLDLNKYLPKNGFELEFRPHVIDRVDVHGIPRIWRRRDPKVVSPRDQVKVRRTVEITKDVDSHLGGAITWAYRRIKRLANRHDH